MIPGYTTAWKFCVTKDFKEKFKELSKKEGLSMSVMVRMAFEKRLAEDEKRLGITTGVNEDGE